MKKGFTLIELLIVVVVIATLMGIVFRLAGLGNDAKAKNVTVYRIQKLEFAISAYYAAFGTYPPVPLHGVRDIYRKVDSAGVQYANESQDETGQMEWGRVRAACRSQPVAAEFPYNYDRDKAYFSAAGYDYKPLYSELSGTDVADSYDWMKVRVFKYGVVSFLLPRYLFMLDGRKQYYDGCLQWTHYNRLSSIYDFKNGEQKYSKWDGLTSDLKSGDHWSKGATVSSAQANAISNMPSQIACARWMPALEGIVRGGKTFYGVATHEADKNWLDDRNESSDAAADPMPVYTSGEVNGGGGNKYVLNGMTVCDGWNHELYYYSPAPYQSYQLWSAGPNGRTFPPWIDLKEFRQNHSQDAKTAGEWMADDIIHLSN